MDWHFKHTDQLLHFNKLNQNHINRILLI